MWKYLITHHTLQNNWYQTLRKFKGNGWMWKPDTGKNMKLATIEKTRGYTLISLIKGFLSGGAGKYRSCDLSEFSPLFSHRHTNTRDLYVTHLPPNLYQVMRERGKKTMGISMNKDKTGRQLHWRNNMTYIVTSPHYYCHWGHFQSPLSHLTINATRGFGTHLSHSPGPEEARHLCWKSPAWLLRSPPCPHRWFHSAGCWSSHCNSQCCPSFLQTVEDIEMSFDLSIRASI